MYTPVTDNTNSDEVLQLARHWIRTCTSTDHPCCPNETFENKARYYPSRLIELPPYNCKSSAEQSYKIKLVQTKGHAIQPLLIQRTNTFRRSSSKAVDQVEELVDSFAIPRGHYVTLSHCWGRGNFPTLTQKNYIKFTKDIPLDTLPLTFRQVIDFARRLRNDIRYIWIDALCIIQKDPDDWGAEDDWDAESVRMYDVYRNSFCNISATSAADSSEGIYQRRDPQVLWETEVNVNTDGIPRPRHDENLGGYLGVQPVVRRCKIQDASFWSSLVDDAPVNRRCWVLQERLLAPRVLHFGKDQVAWECRHLDAAESSPYGILPLHIQSGIVASRNRLKGSLPQEYGPRPLVSDPVAMAFQAHESWKLIVERCSCTDLTEKRDRLIALAGIAQLISRDIGREVKYVAGLWESWLASQLLWHVNVSYENRIPMFRHRRPPAWRAPSFSWAAVEGLQGIQCGETIDEDELLFSVDHIRIPPIRRQSERFGAALPGTHLELTCTLHAIRIVCKRAGEKSRYRWQLEEARQIGVLQKKDLSNLYLDCPIDDDQGILGAEAGVCCIAAREDRMGYVSCLVVKRKGSLNSLEAYERVGLARVPSYEIDAKKILLARDSDAMGATQICLL